MTQFPPKGNFTQLFDKIWKISPQKDLNYNYRDAHQ